jgi:5-methyltetrahydropteroyltriglutamate--homocysteine methyltransferase
MKLVGADLPHLDGCRRDMSPRRSQRSLARRRGRQPAPQRPLKAARARRAKGGYEPVAETLLAGIDYDGYFLEYDTDRAGGLEPLRFLPKGKKRVVVGLVTSKTGALEKKDDIKRRLDEAAKSAPLDQLCLSPQCGFASTEEGNVLTEDEQWAKLRLVVDVAREVWGD